MTPCQDEAADEPELMGDADHVERSMGGGYAMAWSNHSRFLHLLPLIMEYDWDPSTSWRVPWPITEHRQAAPILWPLIQKVHYSHLSSLHPDDVLRMVPYVRRGIQVPPSHRGGWEPAIDEVHFLTVLYASCRVELRQPDGRHCDFFRQHGMIIWQLLDMLIDVAPPGVGFRGDSHTPC